MNTLLTATLLVVLIAAVYTGFTTLLEIAPDSGTILLLLIALIVFCIYLGWYHGRRK